MAKRNSYLYFRPLWEEFVKEVDNKNYKRVPYNTYRTFIKPLLPESFDELSPLVKFSYCEESAEVNLINTIDDITSCWDIKDESFGEFLYKRLFFSCKLREANDEIYQNTRHYTPIDETVNNLSKNFEIIDNKENTIMSNKMINFDFGPCTDNNIRMSVYGLAVMSRNGWVSYDVKSENVVDVDIFNFEGRNLFYKMPVAIKDIKVGDIIVHNREAMFVKAIAEDGKSITAVDASKAEIKTILPVHNMFGFDFYTRVVNIMDMCGGEAPSVDSPFGNFLPLMLISENDSMEDILPLMFLSGNKDTAMNPMMLYFLMKDSNSDAKSNLLPLMFMMNNKN